MKRTACLLAVLALLGPASAGEEEPILVHLRQGDLYAALRVARKSPLRPGGEKALEAASRLRELALEQKGQKVSATKTREALDLALDLLSGRFPQELRVRQQEGTARIGLALGRFLASGQPRPRSREHARARHALEQARSAALSLTGKEVGERLREIDLLLVPLYRQIERHSSVLRLGREVLDLEPGEKEKKEVEEAMGLSLLALGRVDKALPFLEDYLKRNPTDPAAIGPIADSLDRRDPVQAFHLLQRVVQADPPPGKREAWTECLDLLYNRVLRRLSPRKPPLEGIIRSRHFRRPVPKVWGYSTWRSGFRQYRDPNERAGKTYAGDDAISAFIPLSKGWRRVGAPPEELRRWHNVAFCLTREGGATILVCYWFAPDLEYWYGHTPRTRGVTGKSAKGHSKGAIFSLVTDTCYGQGARKRGLRFHRTRAPGLTVTAPGVKAAAWKAGKYIYHENFFSMGQVTGEVVLKIHEKDLELLAPELEWTFKWIRFR